MLPHQFHRAAKTVKKTAEHIARVKAAQNREKKKKTNKLRNPKFHYASRKFIKTRLDQKLGCEACGSRQGLQTHHCIPFNTDSSLEMERSNWIVLCEAVGGLECHQMLGHGSDFHYYNKNIRNDAAELMRHPERLEEIKNRAKKNRIPNSPIRDST